MRVVKSISLPVDLAQKAELFDNLSLYVQDCIKYGIEHNLNVYQKSRLHLSQENREMDNLLHFITDIILTKGVTPSKKLLTIKRLLVANKWIVEQEDVA